MADNEQRGYEVEVVADRNGGVRIKKYTTAGREVAWISITAENRAEFLAAFREACAEADGKR